MRIYTSFFDNWRVLKPYNIIIVSVTERKPKGFSDMPVLHKLVPNDACKNAPKGKFSETYWKEVLLKNDPILIYGILKAISVKNYNADIALCDFNTPSERNFRRQIALWLQKRLKIYVPEFMWQLPPNGLKIEEYPDTTDIEEKALQRNISIIRNIIENNRKK